VVLVVELHQTLLVVLVRLAIRQALHHHKEMLAVVIRLMDFHLEVLAAAALLLLAETVKLPA
jgi:hypothetical protein